MKDPFVAEVRKYRMEHTKQFHSNIHEICNDLKKYQKNLHLVNNINKDNRFMKKTVIEK